MGAQLTVGVCSDALEETAVVKSMLWLLKGKSADSWTFGESSTADLLMLGSTSVAPPVAANASRIVARFVESGMTIAGDDMFALSRPVRVMPFLALLNEAGRQLQERTTSRTIQAAPP